MAGDRRAVLEDALQSFAAADLEGWRAAIPRLFEPEAEWQPALATHPYSGYEELARWLEVMTEGFSDYRLELHGIEEVGDCLLSLHHFHGIFNATGVVVERKIGIVWKFDGERVTRATSYFGWDEARAAARA
jgi:ketosteroid isomerase-like protein